MAFKSARATRYETHTDPTTGEPIKIVIAGVVEDDASPIARYGEYHIRGAELAALPPADPATADTPADPRFQAIERLVGRFLVALQAQWAAEIAAEAAQPIVTARTAAEIAQLPILTQLPSITPSPSPPPDVVTFPRPIPPQDVTR